MNSRLSIKHASPETCLLVIQCGEEKKTQSGSDNQCCLNNCKKWIDGTTQWAKKCVRLTLSIFFLTLETGKLEHSLILASANFLIVNRPVKLKQILRAQECVWQGEGVDLWSVISSNDPVARWFLPLTRLCKCFPTASHKFNELICLYSYHWFKYRKENDFRITNEVLSASNMNI